MHKKKTIAAVFILGLAVVCAAVYLPGFMGGIPGAVTPQGAGVGFFSPGGVPEAVVRKTQFGLINAATPAQVEESLKRVQGSAFKVSVDMGPVISPAVDPAKLSVRYTARDGSTQTKAFAPQEQNKLRFVPPDDVLRQQMAPFLDVLAKYAAHVATVFLIDEPYLNGMSKAEMERAARVARQELDARGLVQVKLGVIFASGMFDRDFARMIDARSGVYVNDIDDNFIKGNPSDPAGLKAWAENIKTNRLVTYDRAGNQYVDGGLPRGYDVYSFDFYLSTLLLDGVHEHTLAWLAKRYPQYGCAQFADQPMTQIRSRLSFFHEGTVKQGEQHRASDRALLDAIFECRMGAVTAMLKNAATGMNAQFLMISESSNNGFFEFNTAGNIKPEQPALLVEARVLDEVRRAQSFFMRHADVYSAGLMYFTYQNEYDATIKLNIGGASAMPSVLDDIYRFAAGKPIKP